MSEPPSYRPEGYQHNPYGPYGPSYGVRPGHQAPNQQFGYGPTPPPRRSRRGLWLALAAVATVLVVITVVVAVNIFRNGGAETAAPGPDRWVSAICEPGSLRDGSDHILKWATSSQTCLPKGGDANSDPILLATFGSEDDMMSELRWLEVKCFAWAQDGGRRMALAPDNFYVDDCMDRIAPLQDFGFTINTLD